MNRPAAPQHTRPKALSEQVGIIRAAGMTAAGLAGIAGAISDSHMRQLTQAHGGTG